MSNAPVPLPAAAVALIAQIEATLAEAQVALGSGTGGAAHFALRETGARYLPETVERFLAIPPSLRETPDDNGITAVARFIEALQILHRACRAQLQELSQGQAKALEIQQRFLTERFTAGGPLAEIVSPDNAAELSELDENPQTAQMDYAERLFAARMMGNAHAQGVDFAAVSANCASVFPQLTAIKRTLFGGTITGFIVAIPVAAGNIEYRFSITAHGPSATVRRNVGGVALKTETFPVDVVLAGLFEHLYEYLTNHPQSRARYEQLGRRA